MKNTKELIQKIHSEINKSSGILKDIKVIHEKIKKKWRKQNKKEREKKKILIALSHRFRITLNVKWPKYTSQNTEIGRVDLKIQLHYMLPTGNSFKHKNMGRWKVNG